MQTETKPSQCEVPTGTRKGNEGTNHPGKPTHEGQLGVFRSPYSHSSLLVDIGERDKYGVLRWVALSLEDPRYESAIAETVARLSVKVGMPVESLARSNAP